MIRTACTSTPSRGRPRDLLFVVSCVLIAASAGACQLDQHAGPSLRSARAAAFSPWDEPSPRSSPHLTEVDAPRGTTDGLVALYQHALRAETLPEGGCPFTPTCSVYARQAIESYGPLLGLVMAIDRLLIREHLNIHHHYPHVRDGSRTALLDPVP